MIKVLIVDDEQFVRVSLRTLYDWEGNGFELVGAAADGFDALKKIEEHEPDIVITDIAMPNMDGLALLAEINARGLRCVTMVISNLGDLQNVKSALKLGAEDYFLKVDFEREEFHNVMQKLKAVVLNRETREAEAGSTAAKPADASANHAAKLADALKSGGPSLFDCPHTLHVFCIRVREYLSETLRSFQSVSRPLGNIVMETFKARPTVSYARGPWQDSLLVTVTEEIPHSAVMDILKRLDGQLRVYLQINADILHYSNTAFYDNEALFKKLTSLSSDFSKKDGTQLIYDDDGRGAESDGIDCALKFIDENMGKPISLTEVAAHVGLNPSYLSRVFRRKTGMPLVQYITEQKMKRAALLLRSGNYLVKEAAALLGIEDQYYFTKLFYKVHHMNPSEYIAKNRDTEK